MKMNKIMMIFGLAAGVVAGAHAVETELSEIDRNAYQRCTYDNASGVASCARKDGSRDYFPRAFRQCPGETKTGNTKLGKIPGKWGSCTIYDEEATWQ